MKFPKIIKMKLPFLLRYSLLLACLLSTFIIQAQNKIKSYVGSELKTIQSINPDSVNFDDMQYIGEAIGNSRIVMLGEQAHGDGATYLAKSRLIKYLHEKKGFTVLAFESDLFALTTGWETLHKDKKSIQQFFRNNLYPIWSSCQQCSDLLYSYIPITYAGNSPLKIAGIDNQFHGRYTADSMRSFIDMALKKHKISYSRTREYDTFFLPFLDTISKLNYQKRTFLDSLSRSNFSDEYTKFDLALNQIISEMPQDSSAYFPDLILQNYKVINQVLRFYAKDTLRDIRDERMGNNLIWLAERKYPNEKIIVWAADRHIMKNAREMISRKNLRIQSMGNLFINNKNLEKQTYIIGFTSAYGTTGRAGTGKTNDVRLPKSGFETWIKENVKYGFIDFRKFNILNAKYTKDFKLKALGHGSIPGKWTNVFDGIFYIREMTPCTL